MVDIAICDDSAIDRERLVGIIDQYEGEQKVRIHSFGSGEGLLEAMKKIRFLAIFLDIQMAGIDGEETAREIRKQDINLVLVFYTGFSGPSSKRIEVQPYRYIEKNMSDRQIGKYVTEVMERVFELGDIPVLVGNVYKKQVVIHPQYVIYIEKYKKSTRVHLKRSFYSIYGIKPDEDGQYPDIRLEESLDRTYETLRRYGFGRPHNSYIINFAYLRYSTGRDVGMLEVSAPLPIARSKAKKFNEEKKLFLTRKYRNED